MIWIKIILNKKPTLLKKFINKTERMTNSEKKIYAELDKANAHPYGARPFKRENYINKFKVLTDKIIDKKESSRFLKTVQNLKNLKSGELFKLNIMVSKKYLKRNKLKGIF